MKNLNLKEFYKIVAFMAIVLIFISSCKKDEPATPKVDPTAPNYVGTWIAIEPITADIQMKDIITLTETSFTDLGQIGLSANLWVDYISMKGSISVNGKLMTVTITDLGLTSFNSLNIPTGVITSYKTGSAGFEDLITQSGQPKIFNSEYSVSGNQLTLKTDLNADGDYLDESETTVYTKQ